MDQFFSEVDQILSFQQRAMKIDYFSIQLLRTSWRRRAKEVIFAIWMVDGEEWTGWKWWIACQVGREAEMAIDETILVPRMHRISSMEKYSPFFNGELSKELEWIKNRGCRARGVKEYRGELIYRIKMIHGLHHLNGWENLKIDLLVKTVRREMKKP